MQTIDSTNETTSHRASSYVIYVDLPDTKEKLLLVHGYTGAYDVVSRSVAAYVRSMEKRAVSKPLFGEWMPEAVDGVAPSMPSASTVELLSRRGYLTNKTVAEEEEYFTRHVSAIHNAQIRRMPTYVIMPTYDCNLRCDYCFQDHMRTDPNYNHLLRVMSPQTADRIIDSLDSVEEIHGLESGPGYLRPYTFFGGEPLLRRSRPLIEHFMNRAREKGRTMFGAISNATELESYADLLGPAGIAWLQITLDGPPEQHDKRRIRPDGTGSFAETAANITLALERGVNVTIRMNVDRSNVPMLPQLADRFISEGWNASEHFSAYVAPVHDYNEIGTRGDYFNSWELAKAIEHLKASYPSMSSVTPVDDNLRSRAMQIFTQQHDGMPEKASFCGAHKGMYIFDSFGDIYACWDRTGDKNLRIGEITEDNRVKLNGLSAVWRERSVSTNSTCRSCSFSLYCGGGCAILAEDRSGTIFSNHCDAFGKRFRNKVAEAFVEFSKRGAAGVPQATVESIEEFVR